MSLRRFVRAAGVGPGSWAGPPDYTGTVHYARSLRQLIFDRFVAKLPYVILLLWTVVQLTLTNIIISHCFILQTKQKSELEDDIWAIMLSNGIITDFNPIPFSLRGNGLTVEV